VTPKEIAILVPLAVLFFVAAFLLRNGLIQSIVQLVATLMVFAFSIYRVRRWRAQRN